MPNHSILKNIDSITVTPMVFSEILIWQMVYHSVNIMHAWINTLERFQHGHVQQQQPPCPQATPTFTSVCITLKMWEWPAHGRGYINSYIDGYQTKACRVVMYIRACMPSLQEILNSWNFV